MVYFAEIEKKFLKFIYNLKGPHTTKTSLKKDKVKEIILPNFKTYHKFRVIKIMWYQHEDRRIDKCNRIESKKNK